MLMMRFELITCCLRDSRSAQLELHQHWCPRIDLNYRPSLCRSAALARLSYAGIIKDGGHARNRTAVSGASTRRLATRPRNQNGATDRNLTDVFCLTKTAPNPSATAAKLNARSRRLDSTDRRARQ